MKISRVSAKELASTLQGTGKRTHIMRVTMADIGTAPRPKERVDPKTILPKQYWPWLKVFSQQLADKLSLRRPGIDRHIGFANDTAGDEKQLPYGRLYNMNEEELLVRRETVTETLEKGFVRISKSPTATPVLLVQKPSEGIRFCVDYRGLDEITVKDRYPFSLFREALRKPE